jgi:NADH:ubiquinone oxidoreductase subunit 5 (subunit L)/multisubunit Na+/H+ antiporter MnhA subunit
MPTLLSRLLCALAAAVLALTAGLGLLAFAKYYSFMFLGRPRGTIEGVREPSRRPVGLMLLSLVILFLGTVAPWEIHALGSGLRPLLGFNAATSVISHPLVLGPVFANFSVLAPTWLSIVLPSYAVLALLIAVSRGRGKIRRAPVWVTGSGADIASVQYRPSSYSNPMRVILRGPLGYRTRLVPTGDESEPSFVVENGVVLAIDRFVYAPLTRGALRVAARVRLLQSGRLSVYLLYMLIALIGALSLVPILR